jgi:hypothetical protein
MGMMGGEVGAGVPGYRANIEFFNPIITLISQVNVSRTVYCHAPGGTELPAPSAATAPFGIECPVPVELLDQVIARVGDIVIATAVHSNANWIVEFPPCDAIGSSITAKDIRPRSRYGRNSSAEQNQEYLEKSGPHEICL